MRRDVVWAMSRVGDPGVVPDLIRCLSDPDAEVRREAARVLKGFDVPEARAAVAEAMRRARRPDHPVARSSQIDLGGPVVTVEHPGRGHTDHDLIVVVPGDPAVVFCGDLVEESAEPAIDDGSDLRAWPATLDRVLRAGRQDGIYVPGHGAVVDAAFVRAQRDWLAARP